MTGKLVINGKEYAVSDKFQSEVFDYHPDLAEMAYENLARLRDGLLRLSDRRNSFQEPIPTEEMDATGNLTLMESDRLANIVHVMNCHHAVNFLRGRHHSEFGFDGVDQVHGNAHHAPCGCVLHIIFDHHKRHDKELVQHTHYPKKSCKKHAHLMGDFKAHHEAVKADNAAGE